MKRRRLGYTAASLLKALQEGRRYGLDMMEATGLPSGTVYPTLGRLERRGLVRARWEKVATALAEARPRRRYYTITAEGERALKEALAEFRALAAESLGPASLPEEA